MSYTGWLLPEIEREKLLAVFPPVYHDVIAHHVTLAMGIIDLPIASAGTIVGYIDDEKGVQALVVEIDGTTQRWDGYLYHITWSIDRDTHKRKPVDSMLILRNSVWKQIEPIVVSLIPTVFRD